MFVRKLGFSLSYLAVDMESGDILPLRPMYTGLDSQHSGAPDASVRGSYYSDGDPNLVIPACPIVGFPPLGGNADVQALQSGPCLASQQAID